MLSLLLPVLTLALVVHGEHDQLSQSHLRLFHRIYDPRLPDDSPFTERGLVSITPPFTFEPADDFRTLLKSFVQAGVDAEGLLYQVALERMDDPGEGMWDISSVKACHLPLANSESLILHTTSHVPYALDYFISPVPHDGACPKHSKKNPRQKLEQAFIDRIDAVGLNTTVTVRAPRFPPLPILRSPPPLTPEGTFAKPVPEKTFIQKYWMYIAAVVVALLFSGGAEEEKPHAAAAGSNERQR